MPDLLSQPSGLKIELDYLIDGEYILSCCDATGKSIASNSGYRYNEVQDKFEWMLLELGIFI